MQGVRSRAAFVVLVWLVAIAPARLLAQDGAAPLALARLSEAPRLDGHVDDPPWRAIAPLPLIQFSPDPGGPVRERTEIRVAYDDEYLYASGVFAMRDARRIRANSLVRDRYAEDDYLNLVIDTFDDRQSAVWFIVTPNATRIDGALANDAEGPESHWNRREYDMEWEAATQRTDSGWSVEVRIPLVRLRYQATDGRVTMGLIAARLISDGKERYIFPAILPTRAVAQFKPSLARRVTLEGLRTSRPRVLAPYVLLGGERYIGSSGAQNGLVQRRAIRHIGADLKLGLSSRVTLDLTANTDFAQAEADDQQINLTRFLLFFPEKRQFFLERASVFDFRTGADDRLFYSRRIGLGADGRPTRVFGGARVIGRMGEWDVGAISLLSESATGAEHNAAVVRVRRDLAAAGTYVGAMLVTAGSSVPDQRPSGGLDGTLHLGDDNYVVWSGAVSAPAGSASLGNRATLRASWERRRRAGLFVTTGVSRVGPAYDPGLGFVLRPGTTALDQLTGFGWLRDRGRTREHSLSVATEVVRAIVTGTVETVRVEPAFSLTTARAAQARVFVRRRREVVADTFCLSAALCVPPGTFDFTEGGLTMTSPPGSLARAKLDVQGGTFYGGSRVSVGVSPSWNASPHIELGMDAEVNRVWRWGSVFRGDLARLRTRLSLDRRTALSATLQYNRATATSVAAVRLRHNRREGADLYLVFNDVRVDDARAALRTVAPEARYIAVKYVHTVRK